MREFEAECVWWSVYEVGGGNRESPFHCMAPSKCRLREIQKEEEGSRELGHHGRDEACVCV